MARKLTELWQVGIVHKPVADLLAADALQSAQMTWLPDPGSFRFIADPFGLWHNGRFTVLAEAYDYRNKRGEIHFYEYDAEFKLLRSGAALQKPFHLSYPQIIASDGEIYMLPEAHRSGKLTLYRATRFPDAWEPVADLLEIPAIDASVIQRDGLWWMFYALPGADNRAMRDLHVAWAHTLEGPWTAYSANPVRSDLRSSRPGGQPFIDEGCIHLPVQDCDGGYGKSLHVLRIDRLGPDVFSASIVADMLPGGLLPGYDAGLHTLSMAGEVTLIDVKRLDPSPMRGWIDIQRRFGRLLR